MSCPISDSIAGQGDDDLRRYRKVSSQLGSTSTVIWADGTIIFLEPFLHQLNELGFVEYLISLFFGMQVRVFESRKNVSKEIGNSKLVSSHFQDERLKFCVGVNFEYKVFLKML